MNNRKNFLSVIKNEPNAQMPIVHFGYWDETVDKWVREGHIKQEDDWDKISENLGFDFEYGKFFAGNTLLDPWFEEKVMEEFPDGSVHVLNGEGVVELQKPGVRSIPTEIGHTLTDRGSWEKEYLPRLQFTEDRYDFNKLEQYTNTGNPIGIFCGSLYGAIRNMFGIVGLSYIAVDDEDLYFEAIDVIGNLVYDVAKFGLEKCTQLGVTFDIIHFWEDICFNTGPLVNPTVFREKVGPHYKRVTDLGKKHGVEVFSLDCDGKIDSLVPIWLENGVNTMFPIEVGTWSASIKPWREKYGDALLGIGGMDKRVFGYDKKAVDDEIERLKPLVALGGFIPCPDHRIAPEAKWDLVRYYCDKMRSTFA